MNRPRLLKSSLNVSVLRLLGQVVALFSGLLIANFFGANTATDDYYTALILPGALANLIINALTNLFAPIYLQHVHDDPEQADSILSSMTSVVAVALLLGTLVCLIAVPLMTSSRAIGDGDAYARALTFGFLLVINCPLAGLSRLLGVYSEAQQHYNVPAAVAILNPVIFIVILVLTLPLGVYSLLLANLTTTLVELGILFVYARRNLNLRIRWSLTVHPAVKEMLRGSVAPAIAFLALFLVPTVDRLMATSLDAGSLTAFHYGERIVVAFEALIISGPLLIVYYYWANTNAAKGMQAVAHSVTDTVSLLNFVIIPLCVGGALLRYPIISILFERGAFSAVETSALVFAILLVSQIFSFLIILLTRLLLLIKLTRIQLILSIGVSALNTGFNFAFITPLGLEGIVLSTLLTRIIIAAMAVYFVKRYVPGVSLRSILQRMTRTLGSLLVMVGVILLLQVWLGDALRRESGLLLQVFTLVVVVFMGAFAYTATAWFIRHGDLLALIQIVRQTRYGFLLRRFGATTES